MGKAAVSRYGDGKTIKEVKSYTKINSNVFDLDSKVKQRSKLMTNYGSKKKLLRRVSQMRRSALERLFHLIFSHLQNQALRLLKVSKQR